MEDDVAWKECKVCGKGFEAKGRKKTCGSECSRLLGNERSRNYSKTNRDRCLINAKARYEKKVGRVNDWVKICSMCNSNFTSKAYNAKFCSRQCYNKSQLSNGVTRICKQCGERFNTKTKSITCSKECKNDYQKEYMSIYRPNHQSVNPDIYVRSELKFKLGFEPPPDLVEEATALRLLNRAIRNTK